MRAKKSIEERFDVHLARYTKLYISNLGNHTTPFVLVAEARTTRSYGQS